VLGELAAQRICLFTLFTLDEHTAKKVRRHPEERKKTRTRVVGDEGGIQRI
jgi:hypothetical protein